MDDKINLDELLDIISGYDTEDNSDISINDVLSNEKNEVPQDEYSHKDSKEINVDIIKPDSVSITGTFEAIRTKKTADKTIVASMLESEQPVEESVQDKVQPEDKKESVEITADIERKRYFSTEEFENIKNKGGKEIKQSLVSFTKGAEEEDDGEEEYFKPRQATEEIDDFGSIEEREDILIDLKKMKSSASFKAFLTFLLTAFSAVIFIAVQSGISIPGLDSSNSSKLVLTIIVAISTIASLVNFNSLISGVAAIIKFKFAPETLLFFLFLFNTALNIIYLFGNQSFDGNYVSFDFIYMLLLTFNIYSKKILVKNIYKNFLIVSSEGQKTVVDRPESEMIANDIILETGNGGDILYATKSKFVSDFIHNSFKDFDICSKGSGFYTFCSIVIFILIGVTYFISESIVHTFVYAAGAFSAVTPFMITYAFAVSIFVNSSKARRFGGVIVGSDSAYALEDAQTLIVDDSDVFNVTLNGIRLYGDTEIDDCIVFLNSLFSNVGGPLKKLFADMFADNVLSLPRADEIYYHDSLGYSCLIHSKVFAVGNKNLMEHFGVEINDSEFEIIYQQKTKNVLFASYDGKLIGVFLLTYSLSHGVSNAFSVFESDQMNVCIAERDANITQNLLNHSFKSSDKSLFSIMKFRTARKFFEKFEIKNKTASVLLSNTGLKGIAAGIHGCRSMLFANKTNNVIKIISSLISIILITFLLAFSEPSVSLPFHILVFQALWSLPIIFVSLFSK